MSPKRVVLFVLLIVSAPVWLALRSRFGDRFMALLAAAWGIGYGSVWVLAQPMVAVELEPLVDLGRVGTLFPVLLEWYYASMVLWIGQLGFALLQRLGVMMGELEAPHPWYTGTFWVCRFNYAVPDLIGMGCCWIWLAGALANRVPAIKSATPLMATVMVGSFLLMAYVSYLNSHALPFRARAAKANGQSKPNRYLARLRSSASRSR